MRSSVVIQFPEHRRHSCWDHDVPGAVGHSSMRVATSLKCLAALAPRETDLQRGRSRIGMLVQLQDAWQRLPVARSLRHAS